MNCGIIVGEGMNTHHADDPADRFIIATALENDLPVVTSDDKFEKYGVKTIR